jgi:uncharacterized protein
MLTLDFHGTAVALLPERAAWLPATRALLVADAHVGKAQSFRRLGVPVPEATTADTLGRLSALVARLGAVHVAFLGDLLHSAHAQSDTVQHQLADWRRCHAGLHLTLVRGNHDDRAGDPPPALGIEVVDEPHTPDGAPGLALAHHPTPGPPGRTVLAGHLHPCVHLDGRARQRLRLPCFHWQPGLLVLPAFGAFTGMHPVARRPGDRVFAVADTQVREVPARALPTLCG